MKNIKRVFTASCKFCAKLIPVVYIAIPILTVGTVAFLLLYPFNVGEFREIRVLNQVQSGATIEYEVDYCRNVDTSVRTEVRRFLMPVNSNLRPIELSSRPSIENVRSKVGCQVSPDPIVLSVDAAVPTGTYKLMIEVRYCIFLTRCIPTVGESAEFEVTRPTVSMQLDMVEDQLNRIYDQLELDRTVANVLPPAESSNTSGNITVLPIEQYTPLAESQAAPAPIATPTPQRVLPEPEQQSNRSILRELTRQVDRISDTLGL